MRHRACIDVGRECRIVTPRSAARIRVAAAEGTLEAVAMPSIGGPEGCRLWRGELVAVGAPSHISALIAEGVETPQPS